MSNEKSIFHFVLLVFVIILPKNNFSVYYNDENIDPQTHSLIKAPYVKIIETTDLAARFQEYVDKGYILLGSAHFVDEWAARALAVDTAKSKGASVVILSSVKTSEVEHNYILTVPVSNVSYHSGTVDGTFYSGTSTLYSYQYIPQSYKTNNYEQSALFLAKEKKVLTNENTLFVFYPASSLFMCHLFIRIHTKRFSKC